MTDAYLPPPPPAPPVSPAVPPPVPLLPAPAAPAPAAPVVPDVPVAPLLVRVEPEPCRSCHCASRPTDERESSRAPRLPRHPSHRRNLRAGAHSMLAPGGSQYFDMTTRWLHDRACGVRLALTRRHLRPARIGQYAGGACRVAATQHRKPCRFVHTFDHRGTPPIVAASLPSSKLRGYEGCNIGRYSSSTMRGSSVSSPSATRCSGCLPRVATRTRHDWPK